MITSIVRYPLLQYPGLDGFFGAEQSETGTSMHLPLSSHPVYDAVGKVLSQTGLVPENSGKKSGNPLGTYTQPGSRVFVLCNFVYHRRPNESKRNFYGKCTHGSVLAAVLDYCLQALGPQGSVGFGNAPLQSCNWKSVLTDTGAGRVVEYCKEHSLPVAAKDLRLFVMKRGIAGNIASIEKRDDRDGIEVDLGKNSLLAELPRTKGAPVNFRVSDYSPDRIQGFHANQGHRYIIHREILASDVIIHVPKLKTHEKVGITCGLKGFVGTIGHKDCLAHYRLGDPETGGDEYPKGSMFCHTMSWLRDFVYRGGYPKAVAASLQIIINGILWRFYRLTGGISAGAWHGNDTAWRMALDIARIAYYADKTGKLRDTPQRRHLLLIDGLIGGEGNGPLSPKAVSSGVLIFSDNVAMGDRIACRLMGYDPNRIPIVREAFRDMSYPLASERGEDIRIVYNGKEVAEPDIEPALGRAFIPPKGWKNYLLKRQHR